MSALTDRELLELAAKAAGIELYFLPSGLAQFEEGRGVYVMSLNRFWNPLAGDGDRYRLARQLGINIDFADCCAWKRMPNGSLIQEFWGGEFGDEAHAVVRAAAEIGKAMP